MTNTFESNYQQLFNYFKTSLTNDEVVVTHPINNSSLTRGIVTILPLVNQLAGKYICNDARGDEFQLTCYHQNFAEILKLGTRVKEKIKDYVPNLAPAVNVGHLYLCKELHPKYIGSISLWQSIFIIRWYFDET
jgi:hypothetical protein